MNTEMTELSNILMESPDTAHLRLSDDNPSFWPDWPCRGPAFYDGYYAALDDNDEPIMSVHQWHLNKHWHPDVKNLKLSAAYDTPAEAMRAAITRWRESNKAADVQA